jgi:hypothetical protein
MRARCLHGTHRTSTWLGTCLDHAQERSVSRDVLSDFAVEVSEALLNMSREAVRLAACFRGPAIQEAQGGLVELTTELRQFPALVNTLTGPLAIDPEHLRIRGRSLDEQIADLQSWLQAIVGAHERSDWLTVADVLELDLAPMLAAWAPQLRACLLERGGAAMAAAGASLNGSGTR